MKKASSPCRPALFLNMHGEEVIQVFVQNLVDKFRQGVMTGPGLALAACARALHDWLALDSLHAQDMPFSYCHRIIILTTNMVVN